MHVETDERLLARQQSYLPLGPAVIQRWNQVKHAKRPACDPGLPDRTVS
jgi:hypothetical protein